MSGVVLTYPAVQAVAQLDYAQGNIAYLSDLQPQVEAPELPADEANKTLNPTGLVSSLGGLASALFGPTIPAQNLQLFGTSVQLPSFGVFLQLLQQNSDVNVLSNPHFAQALAFGMFVVLAAMMLIYVPLQRRAARWSR